MSDQNVELLRGAYEAFGRGDIPAILAILDDDVVWNTPEVLPHGMAAHGREEVGQFFERLASVWDELGVQVDDYIASDGRVCVTGTATGKLGDVRTGYGFVHSWTLNDGTATGFHEYIDPQPSALAR
jgi:uncharacterized protein